MLGRGAAEAARVRRRSKCTAMGELWCGVDESWRWDYAEQACERRASSRVGVNCPL
jgi:hypothetical protein